MYRHSQLRLLLQWRQLVESCGAALMLLVVQGPFKLQHLRKLCAAEVIKPSTVIYSAETGSQRLDKLLAGEDAKQHMGTAPVADDGARFLDWNLLCVCKLACFRVKVKHASVALLKLDWSV